MADAWPARTADLKRRGQDIPIDAEFYGRITDALGAAPMDGLLMHLCVQSPAGGLRYIDVWESKEHFGAPARRPGRWGWGSRSTTV